MASRGWVRALVVLRGIPTVLRNRLLPAPAGTPRRILIAGWLFLGDTLMLAPLLAKLRREYPAAELVITVPPAFLPLFAGRPWGTRAVAWSPADAGSIPRVRALGPFDLALVPADNRFSWIAAAAGARRIVAFAGDPRWRKRLPVTDFRPLPTHPLALGDLVATLIDGEEPAPFRPGDWPAPVAQTPALPTSPYAILHLGASTPLKMWPAERWREAVRRLQSLGLEVVLACGRGEEAGLDAVDAARDLRRFPGNLDLAQYWHLLAAARLLVCPDTGIAHLARLTNTPAVVLYGPGSPLAFGPGRFWHATPFVPLWQEDMPCRNQNRLFAVPVTWMRQCRRTPKECSHPVCILALGLDELEMAAHRLLQARQ